MLFVRTPLRLRSGPVNWAALKLLDAESTITRSSCDKSNEYSGFADPPPTPNTSWPIVIGVESGDAVIVAGVLESVRVAPALPSAILVTRTYNGPVAPS